VRKCEPAVLTGLGRQRRLGQRDLRIADRLIGLCVNDNAANGWSGGAGLWERGCRLSSSSAAIIRPPRVQAWSAGPAAAAGGADSSSSRSN
jgi:hypothetical protein